MHLGKWGLAPTLHIGFFSHPVFFMTGPRITEVSLYCIQQSQKAKKSRLKSKTFALPSDGMSFDTTVS